ncbi:ABC transporter substrate-binding protein [Phytohabitans sp. ZYX-F-186]|uniref:ABC transporter substrate-binding protein n=1 Tax=Phytohabitans maris TaxID=3071409 RepID=A0ABU0ZDZ2_9ACTN|nr:ABC transporter substrate-binding protein [Phytohabitans sp. ZYX-F-186]MDQ7905281.1 ABC transporter substrate-binding protein [Phytohabitans sp. ZYX-F-186]
MPALPSPAQMPEVARRSLLRGAFAGAVLLGAPALVGCRSDAPAGAGSLSPRRGGNLRVVVSGASTTDDVLDPHLAGSWGGGAVAKNIFDKLVAHDNDLVPRPRLAEKLEPNADGTVWTVRLRRGVTWHDGKPLTAADVLWSVRRILDPANKLPAAADLAMVDAAASRVVDDHTVELRTTQPMADLGGLLAGWYVYVVQDGTNRFDREHPPVGTGPFRFDGWAPGERTKLVRNDRYWEAGKPYVDSVEIILAAEADARLNVLLSGQADIVHEMSYVQAKAEQGNRSLTIHASAVGTFHSFNMFVDREPFTDPRVREALKLAVDREAIVESVFFGYGEVGNDLYGKGAPNYADAIPQRVYDPDRARALLREAGKENLRLTLHTADVTPGYVQAALLFAEHAKRAGITIEVSKSAADSYWTDVYLKRPFTQTSWGSYALEWFYGQALVSGAASNETGWRRPAWDQRFALAMRVLPGDAADVILAKGAGAGTATPAQKAALRAELGLDRPAVEQYLDWMAGVLRGDLGRSSFSGRPVTEIVAARLPNTLVLAAVATAVLVPVAVGFGAWAGARAGRTRDRVVTTVAVTVGSLPEFVTATLLIAAFAFAVPVLPAVSMVAPGAHPLSTPEILVLPVVTLVAVMAPQSIRMVRAQMSEVMATEYVRMARLHGIPERRIVTRHALRNALAPAMPLLAGSVTWLVGGIVVVETVFNYPGISQDLVRAIGQRDLPYVQSVTLLFAAVTVAGYLLADLAVVALVPKLRTAGGRRS